MTGLAPLTAVSARVETVLGAPVRLRELKYKPGRRRTLRAGGPLGSAIVKLYASARAPQVAARVAALSEGPAEPRVPEVLLVDHGLRAVVLSDVPGTPLGEAILSGEPAAAERAGSALAAWHGAWHGRRPPALRRHSLARECDILIGQTRQAPPELGARVRAQAEPLCALAGDWTCSTVVHRDLYEDQILLGQAVGLIDLDDAALGPPELDVGNLLAHLDLLELRSGSRLGLFAERFLDAYAARGPALDATLLRACRELALLRLACIHGLEELADGRSCASPLPTSSAGRA